MKGCVAVIPARAGSVRVPHKNIYQISGVPLIAIAVQQALMIPEIEEVYVSTDSELYAEIARNYGATVPFLRPADISTAEATDYDVFLHFLRWYRDTKGELPSLVVQIRATAPMRDLDLVRDAIRIMKENPEYDSLRSVSVPHQSPYKMWTPANGHELCPLLPNVKGYDGPTQSLPRAYGQDGVVDIIRPATVLEKHSISGDRIAGILNPYKNWDIDNTHDLETADHYFRESGLFGMLRGTPFGGCLGIIQGRLTEAPCLQCFPSDWRAEFPIGRQCGYHCIEWIRDTVYNPDNPLYAESDPSEGILSVARQSGVAVRSVCDDFVQTCDWRHMTTEDYRLLTDLLIKAFHLRASVVVYPLFLDAAVDTDERLDAFIGVLSVLAPLAKSLRLNIATEISADAERLREIFRRIPWDNVGYCLDTGNLAAGGFSVDEILSDGELAPRIMHVHLKDRDVSGANVVPGSGIVDFRSVLSRLYKIGYSGLLITETGRGDDAIRTAVKNRDFFAGILTQI